MRVKKIFAMSIISLAATFLFASFAFCADAKIDMTGGGAKKTGYSSYYTKEQIAQMGIDNLDAPDDDKPMFTGKLTTAQIAFNSKKIWMKEMADYGVGISAENFKKKWFDEEGWKDPKQILIDLRTIPEYQMAHIPGAIRVDTGLMPWYIHTVAPDNEATVYIMCKGGNPAWGAARGAFWVHYMKTIGYKNPLNITDGFRGWIENGFPVQNNHGMFTFIKGTFQKPDPYLKPELAWAVKAQKPSDAWLNVPGENAW